MQPSISLTTTIAPLEWWVAPVYKLVDFPDGHTPQRTRRTLIVARGCRQFRRYTIGADARTRVAIIVNARRQSKALVGEHSIFLDLANTLASCPRRNSPEAFEAARAFVEKWGMLVADWKGRSPSATVEAFLERASLMLDALADAERNGWRLSIDKRRLINGVTLGNGLDLQPTTLFQFCWLELIAAFKSELQFYRCRACGRYGLKREPLGRRGRNRQTCDATCRKRANRPRSSRSSPRPRKVGGRRPPRRGPTRAR